LVSPALAQKIWNWRVLDEESLSDHFYIEFEISPENDQNSRTTPKLLWVDLNKFKTALLAGKVNTTKPSTNAEQHANALFAAIHDCCSAPNINFRTQRKSVHWWTPEISALRKEENHRRRLFQRKRKRLGTESCTAEANEAKSSKMKLVYAIRKAKEEAWKKLCDDVEHNPWGLPYKLVMGKLSSPSQS